VFRIRCLRCTRLGPGELVVFPKRGELFDFVWDVAQDSDGRDVDALCYAFTIIDQAELDVRDGAIADKLVFGPRLTRDIDNLDRLVLGPLSSVPVLPVFAM